MKFKSGVKVFGMRPEIILAAVVADEIYSKWGSDLVVTSVVDGRHSTNSLHYAGQAIDLRTRNVGEPKAICDEIEEALTDEYDVVLESDHIHVEFQPKRIG